MIKKWVEFIREFVENENYLDAKMQEIKDLIDNIAEGQSLIYGWENKNDHELFINFTTDEVTLRYEFDIDDLKLTKIASNVIDFETAVNSIDDGLSIIEKDIHSVLGISESYSGQWESSLKTQDIRKIYPTIKRILEIYPGESADSEGIIEELERKLSNYDNDVIEEVVDILMFGDPDISFDNLERKLIDLGDKINNKQGTEPIMIIKAFEDAFEVIEKHFYLTEKSKNVEEFKKIFNKLITESKYEENISIVIEAGEGNAFIKNKSFNLEINKKLMKILDKQFNLNLGEISDKHKIDGSKVSEISKFLTSIGLKKDEVKNKDRVKLSFGGKLTLKELKKIK